MQTLSQIAYSLNLTPSAILYRFKQLGIPGKKRILTLYYTNVEVEKVSYKKKHTPKFPLLSNLKHYNNQIDIIEMHLKNQDRSAAEISRVLNLNISICERAIKYFKKRECLIIQSRL